VTAGKRLSLDFTANPDLSSALLSQRHETDFHGHILGCRRSAAAPPAEQPDGSVDP
jgi:hypothetical protein